MSTDPLSVEARVVTDRVRLPGPLLVEVRVSNSGSEPILVNGRLAVGYQESQSRELFAEVYRSGSDQVVSEMRKFYERDFSPPQDFVWLAPGESVSTTFDLLEWYQLPSPGSYELVVIYQGDEPLGFKPEDLLRGTYRSDRVPFSVAD